MPVKFQRPSGDFQRQLCYHWETVSLGYFTRGRISLEQAREKIQQMCFYTKLPMPKLDCRKRNGGAHVRTVAGVISFDANEIKPFTPIHEFAHYSTPILCGHGPQFIRNYVHLLTQFADCYAATVVAENALWDDAVSFGLSVARQVQFGLVPNCERAKGIDITDLYDDLKDLV